MKKISIYDDSSYSFEEAKAFCKERYYEDTPKEEQVADYEPSNSEVEDEIYTANEISWSEARSEMQNFFKFDEDKYLLKGYAGTWRGQQDGGSIIENWNTLAKAWANGDYGLKIYDEGGKFVIEETHHDGTNHWEVKKLTKKGEAYLNRHEYDDPRTLHEKLWSKGYSVNLHFAKKVYGC